MRQITRTIEWLESVDLGSVAPATAREWGERLFGARPAPIQAAIAVRNVVVRPFGVESFASRAGEGERTGPKFLGPFPVIAESLDRIEFGIADRHLSFRSSLTANETRNGTRIEVTTTVTTHNVFGRIYARGLRLGHPLVMRVFFGRLARSHGNRGQ
ncbi:DUF2867 domain-containing protein [Leifsonia shinshuensis]|nr:DUF2867 domain-containing protein [Leifsonia shinshuensis]